MVSFWPWRGDDSSPASFEKTLSTLSTKINNTQAQLDQTRATSRRIRVLLTLYLSFAYLVYAIVLLLVVGWRNMGVYEWSGISGFPLVIYIIRIIFATYYNFRMETLSTRLKDQQASRAKTIQKLKDATKYDSTLQLLEKYGGPEANTSKGKRAAAGEDGDLRPINDKKSHHGAGSIARRTNIPPPATANIPRDTAAAALQTGGLGLPPASPELHPGLGDVDVSAEFAPNAFDKPAAQLTMPLQHSAVGSQESHWYDRILDLLLGEDETAAKHRIVLLCSRCRLVNGQAPPGTKNLAEVGMWKCMACGAMNGEMDEGKRIVKELLGHAGSPFPSAHSDDSGVDGPENGFDESSGLPADADESESGLQEALAASAHPGGSNDARKRKGEGEI
ncbi:Protein lunapark [Pleurostoma richardsiae]|uniref:Endoplasmic reticulum junction formation protein lunapark n=1 Tax=Pleurostoma richardsiae TaxID=41990 RepID=A0AA38RAA6_9PEZI|nr:Protein lunapark [Pleurostoma richardsiae]